MLAARPPQLAVLASGRGSNFEALALASRKGELGGTIALLLCDHADAPVLERARCLGVESMCPPTGRFRTRLEDESPWLDALRSRAIDVLLLAGFMRRLHETLLGAYEDRVLNIHPSLLPAFPGLDAIRQAFEHGARVTGCTVHLVTAELDAGPIVAQRAIEIRMEDTLESLEARMHEAEHTLYPEAVRRFLGEAWHRAGRRIVFEGRPAEAAHG
ncbi:MAG TPA: phosphoribosylglycinamide formyltransferase [Terriglobales bacterium]|nr:phosphoribosylglycinamide formyltransferase [Terriglobales bacterium]